MKNLIVFLLGFNLVIANTYAQKHEFKIVTTIESIVPNGLGSSRMISSNETLDYKEFTSTRLGNDKSRNNNDRPDITGKSFEETKLLNFFNLTGIRFENIACNDAVITSKLNKMTEEGWELAFVNSAVESSGSKDDNVGIFITRYLFKRLK